MNNTVMAFDKEELEEFIVSDYFSKKHSLYNLFDEVPNLSSYLDTYQLSDDDKLERVAYELYQNEDYWDILLRLNDRNPMFEMPYSLDVIEASSEAFWNRYSELIYFNSPLNDDRLLQLIDQCIESCKIDNELYRFIYIVKPAFMGDFIRLIREKGYL